MRFLPGDWGHSDPTSLMAASPERRVDEQAALAPDVADHRHRLRPLLVAGPPLVDDGDGQAEVLGEYRGVLGLTHVGGDHHDVTASGGPPRQRSFRWAREPDAAIGKREGGEFTLEALPDGEREALLLFAWEDLSYQSVAEALEIPIGTVRSRLNRARAHLRELLEPGGKKRVKRR